MPIRLLKSDVFDRWLLRLRDRQAKARIEARIRRLGLGHLGDVQPIGEGISELRIHHGPGYRVYFTRRGPWLVLLLCGGDKSSQRRDIAQARRMARQFEE